MEKENDSQKEQEPKKILIIEDDSTFVQVLMNGLATHPKPYKLFTADNGEDGLKKAIEIVPDIILLDLIMPKMRGEEFLKIMREHDALKEVPVLIVSQLSDIESMAQGVSFGIKGYILKADMSLESIIAKIDEVLS